MFTDLQGHLRNDCSWSDRIALLVAEQWTTPMDDKLEIQCYQLSQPIYPLFRE